MEKFFVLFGLVLFFALTQGCKNPERSNTVINPAPASSSRTSLDWQGTYYGVLPCADCEGIETVISIFYNHTFVKKTRYIGEENNVFEIKGTFTWNELGNIITFDGKHNKYTPGGILVGEMQLFLLDRDGKRMTGDLAENYRLPKVPEGLFGKTWKLIELTGAASYTTKLKIQAPFLILNESEQRFAANAGCNNIMGQYELDQDSLRLRFLQVASTLMACPHMNLEAEFVKMIEEVDSYSLNGDTLTLNRARMAPMARFVADYFKR